MGKEVFLILASLLILMPFVSASDFGYDNPTLPNIPSLEVTVVTFQNNTGGVNTSNWWDDKDTHNATQMETSDTKLNILETWFKTLWDAIFGAKDTDDLTEGSTNLYDNRSWNETKLAVTYYNATSINVLEGTHDAGDLESIQTYDEESYNVSEAVGAPAIDIRINFTGITDFNQLIVRMKTTDAGKHRYIIQIYDYVLNGWEDYTNFVEVDTYKVMSLGVYDSSDHINGGVVAVRFYLGESGIPAHKIYLDWVGLSLGPATFSTNEIDPLSFHRGENINASNYNISASYFFGDGSLLTGITGGIWTNVSGTATYGDNVNITGNLIVNNSDFVVNDGKVGIGTASPTAILKTVATGGNAIIRFVNPNTDESAGFHMGETDTAGTTFQQFGSTHAVLPDFFWITTPGNVSWWGLDNFGIGPLTPLYPLHVKGNVSGISIWSDGNVSASGYITRTTTFDSSKNVWDYIKDANDYLDEGEIDHTLFYGYAGEFDTTDFSIPVEIIDEISGETIITYPHTKKVGGVLMDAEVELLRQAVYELKQENEMMEGVLCEIGNWEFCPK